MQIWRDNCAKDWLLNWTGRSGAKILGPSRANTFFSTGKWPCDPSWQQIFDESFENISYFKKIYLRRLVLSQRFVSDSQIFVKFSPPQLVLCISFALRRSVFWTELRLRQPNFGQIFASDGQFLVGFSPPTKQFWTNLETVSVCVFVDRVLPRSDFKRPLKITGLQL